MLPAGNEYHNTTTQDIILSSDLSATAAAPMVIEPAHTTILSESTRIVQANYSHFFALALFFLPLLFTVDFFHQFLENHPNVVVFHLLYILSVYLLTFCAIGTISYSTYQVLMGKPVNYLDALKSLTFSFFPLVSTAIISHVLLFAISLAFFMFAVSVLMLGKILGFVIDFNSIYFIWFSVIVIATLIVTIIYFQMNLWLASIIAVAESRWGIPALMRSWYLVKGMRSVSLSLLLYFLVGNGLLAWASSQAVLVYLSRDTLSLVLFKMLGSFFLMMCLVANTVANAVLYMYCKAFHGELGLEISEGFNYIKLPSDDLIVPPVVSVVDA